MNMFAIVLNASYLFVYMFYEMKISYCVLPWRETVIGVPLRLLTIAYLVP